jgi:K+-transporting ATPase KdpF subunit
LFLLSHALPTASPIAGCGSTNHRYRSAVTAARAAFFTDRRKIYMIFLCNTASEHPRKHMRLSRFLRARRAPRVPLTLLACADGAASARSPFRRNRDAAPAHLAMETDECSTQSTSRSASAFWPLPFFTSSSATVSEESSMVFDYILGGTVTFGLLIYLVYALTRPEKF